MCGIFGVVSTSTINSEELRLLAHHSGQRGKDSSGLFISNSQVYDLHRANKAITSLLSDVKILTSGLVMGHSRLITNGLADNQPVYRDGVCVIHNGIVVNHDALWSQVGKVRHQEIDTEIIAAIAADHLERGGAVDGIAARVLGLCEGIVACAVALPHLGKLYLFSNNGSLYLGCKGKATYFASEMYPLTQIDCEGIEQIRHKGVIFDIPLLDPEPTVHEQDQRTTNLIPSLGTHKAEEALLEYKRTPLGVVHVAFCPRRCLTSDLMRPVCNYCHSYKPRNRPKPVDQLFELVEPFGAPTATIA